jgi:hypothetical protein
MQHAAFKYRRHSQCGSGRQLGTVSELMRDGMHSHEIANIRMLISFDA